MRQLQLLERGPENDVERWLVATVRRQADQAGIGEGVDTVAADVGVGAEEEGVPRGARDEQQVRLSLPYEVAQHAARLGEVPLALRRAVPLRDVEHDDEARRRYDRTLTSGVPLPRTTISLT